LDVTFAPSFFGSSGQAVIYALALQPDGKVIAAGNFSSGSAQNLVRFTASGIKDGTFSSGIGGITARAIIMDPRTSRIFVGATLNSPPGERVGQITCLNSNGLPVAGFDVSGQMFGRIRALALDGAGRLLVASGNTNTSGTWTSYVRRLTSQGIVETNFTTALDGDVYAILSRPADDTMLVAGEFSFANGVRRRGVARLRGDAVVSPVITNQPVSQSVATGQPVAFQVGTIRPLGDAIQWYFNGAILHGATAETLTLANPLTSQAGEYYAVVTNISGIVTSAVVTLTVAPPDIRPGRVDFEFTSSAGLGPDAPVYALALQPDGRLLIGGAFSNVQGVARQRIARLNTDGSLDQSFDSSALGFFDPSYSPAVVRAIAVQSDGKVIMGGYFWLQRGSPLLVCLARLNEDGPVDPSFRPGPWGEPETRSLLIEPDSQILIGRIGAGGLLRLRAVDGMRDTGFQANLDDAVLAIGRMDDGRIFAGGKFTQANGEERNRIARFHSTGELDLSFRPGAGANSDVNALAIQQDRRVIIGGLFTSVGGLPRVRVARLNTDGSLDESFDPGLGPNAAVNALVVEQDGSILITGEFTQVGSAPRSRIARLKSDGSLDASFDPGTGANGSISALALRPGSGIYAGGAFTSFDGAPRARVARLHPGVVLTQPQLGASGFTVTVNTATGRTYWLDSTDDLSDGTWAPVVSVVGNGLAQTLTASPSSTAAFYRVRAE